MVQQQQEPAVTILPQQQATSLVAQHQEAVLAAQQQLKAAQAALSATTPTFPTGQPPTQNITFANTSGFPLNLEMANQGILDYTTTKCRKVYETVTRALSTVGYNCDPNSLYQELETLSEWAHIFGWLNPGGITWIPDSLVTAPTTRQNIIEEFGINNYATIFSWEQPYIHQPTRAAQDMNHMYHCVINSLSK